MWAALFPGQGSQSIGMGRYLFDNFSSAQRLFEEGSDWLSLNLKKLCFEGPEEELQKTKNSQVVILLVSFATYRVAKEEFNFSFDFSAGHSVGEYAALVTSNSLNFKEALQAVRKRGIFMQEATPIGKGGMLAIQGLSSHEVLKLCEWAKKTSGLSPLEPAAFNAPQQTILSGSSQLIHWVKKNTQLVDQFLKVQSKPSKIRFIPLKVSAPFHCSLMKPAEEKMKSVLNDIHFKDSNQPIIQNVFAKPVKKANELKENLISQITKPVQWVQSIETLKNLKIQHFVELGNSKVLSGLLKKIYNYELSSYNTHTIEDFKNFENAWMSSSK